MENKEELLEQQIMWYNFIPSLFEIAKSQKNRELSFIAKNEEGKRIAVRYLVGWSVNYLKKHLDWINYKKKLFKTYQSVAKLKDIPIFSYNLSTRLDDEAYKDFNKNFQNHIIGYDLFLDFDGKDEEGKDVFEKCFEEAKEMKKILDEFKVPYFIVNSSLRGFHFRIPAEFMPEPDLVVQNEVIRNIAGIYSFQTLDKTVVDDKRLCKTPYSCVSDGSVVLPLDDSMFLNFNQEMIKIPNVLKNIKLKNRGLLTRYWGLSEEKLKKNVLKFIEEFK